MSQRRTRDACPHGDDGRRPYPVYSDEGWKLGVDADLDAALAKLETALTACASALPSIATSLTSQDVHLALKSMPLEKRPAVLLPLGLTLRPRQISQGLCRDVRGRLSRADDHQLHHALAALGYAVFPDLHLAVSENLQEPDVDASTPHPIERWGERLCRSTVWGAGLSSVADARVWHWAAQQSWFAPDGFTAEQVGAIVVAAAHVIAQSPTFSYLDAIAPPLRPHEKAAATGLDRSGRTSPSPASLSQEMTSPMPEQTEPAPRPIARPGDEPTDAAPAAAAAFHDAFLAALPAADRIIAALNQQCPPEQADVELVAESRHRFDAAAELVAAVGHPVLAESAHALRAAVDSATAASADQDARTRLEAVLGLAAPTGSPLVGALADAQQQATDLLNLRPWDGAARAEALVLSSLVALATTGLDPVGRLELITRVTGTSPALALLAVQAEQLTVPPAAVPPAALPAPAVSEPAPAEPTSDLDDTALPAAEPAESELDFVGAVTDPGDMRETVEAGVASSVTEDTSYAVEGETPEWPADSREPALPIAGPLADVAAPSSDHGVDVEAGIAALIADSRFGLAAAVAAAAEQPPGRQAALRIAALARVVRHQNGSVAAALRTEFDTLSPDSVAEDTASLLLTVPALVRAALITGEPTIGVLLTDLAGHVEPNLSAIADEVGQRTLKGVLLDAQALSIVADVTEAERDLNAIMETARQVRTRHRTLRFKRATDISKILLGPAGVLGKSLSAVERNDVSAFENVVADLARLSDSSFVRSTIDSLDRRFQGSAGRPIEGAGRQDLIDLVTEVLQPLADWVESVRTLEVQTTRGQHWSAGEIAALRTHVLQRSAGALDSLELVQANHDSMTAAAARAAHTSLTGTFAILDGTETLATAEPTPQRALTVELLRVPGARIDVALGAVTVPDGLTAAGLLDAAAGSWDDALRAQIKAETFDAAHALLQAAEAQEFSTGSPGEPVQLTLTESDVAAAEVAVRHELTVDRDLFIATLRRARLNNEISDEQDGELAGLLNDASLGLPTSDLAAVRAILDRAAELLPGYRAEAKSRLSARLDALRAENRVEDATMDRLSKLMDDGQLSTAEELIYFLEIDEDVPDVYQSEDLQRFFPAVPDALPRGVTRDLVQLVKARGQLPGCPVLDFSDLSPDLASLAAEALDAWRQLSTVEPERRMQVNETDLVAPALRLIGIEARRHKRLDDLTRNRDRRFVEFAFEEILGKALVPAFGSKLDKRLRVLFAWGQASADLLISWADGDPSGESLLIAHFGTMSAQTRRDLAAKVARRPSPIVVLDDAALTYLAAHGNRQMTATMNLLLPFSAVNPYLRQKRGVVAPEMFYGRDAERRSVLDPDGTQLVFGGRGLGKSALLNSAAEQFEKQASVGERVAVYLDLKAVGIRRESSIDQEAIWDALLAELTRRELLAVAARAGRRGTAREQVQAGVQSWLDADPRRRLLVLLDEVDDFFEADMPHFMETTRLKSLGQTNSNRIKVVFAGLHSVQRYSKTARNAPFGHMAQRPTVIGPLRPQHAANLLTRPMAALGFDFDDPDLVNRVLGFCSYQPFLLQIFANRLIELMHTTRSSDGVDATEPPYVITRAHVEAVEIHADLRADIRTAFHETLNLDHRYGVIAHVLAQHAHEAGLDSRMTDAQLREDCLSYWPDGFAKLDVEGFRAYLQEMTGLGVLAPNNDGRGWHLRSANVLSMIGTRDDVEAQLVSAAELSVPDEFLALESRLELSAGRRSPLTASQLDDVLGDHCNQVRVIIGSVATGIDHVTAAVKEAADVGHRFVVPPVGSRRQFAEELVSGQAGQRRVVVDDLFAMAPNEDACASALELARTHRPTESGVTRSAVIVAGPDQMHLWREVFAAQADSQPTDRASGSLPVSTVTLRRYNAASLRVWSLETTAFTSEQRRAQLLEVTGGWPHLVESAAALVNADGGPDEATALQELSKKLSSPAGAAEFVDAVGLTADAVLSTAFEGVLSMIDSGALSRADLQVAVELNSGDPVEVECLLALQVFDTDASGRFVVEPCLLRAWPHRN